MPKRKSVFSRVIRCMLACVCAGALLVGCAVTPTQSIDASSLDFAQVAARAEGEGSLQSLAMPDEWANWGETWEDLSTFYSIDHSDTDMSSVEELENFSNGVGDIGDVGYEYAIQAAQKKLTQKYKTSYWDEIPSWARDDDGDWIISYTGTLAFLINEDIVLGKKPTTWADLLKGDYKVAISDVANASLGQYSVYAAAIAQGGDANNVAPGIELFAELARQGRLVENVQSFDDFMKSGAGVQIKWDFLALGFRDQAAALSNPVKLSACIPEDGSVTIGYASIINNKAKNPYAAMLAREYILSDSGQLNLARGYATPIRSVKLPAELEKKRIPRAQYTDAMTQNGLNFTEELGSFIVSEWDKGVEPLMEGSS